MIIRLGFGFAMIAGGVLWFLLNAASMQEWSRGYWTGIFTSIIFMLLGRLLEGAYAGWKEWKARQP